MEADIKEGVRIIPLSEYGTYHTRICRPLGISEEDVNKIIEYCYSKIGYRYDIKNILDLARYLFPISWVPTRHKKKVLEFGSSDSTEVICSSLIAQAFQEIHYPILPIVEQREGKKVHRKISATLFTPSDFDRSPYFSIIKPTFDQGFNYREMKWEELE